MPVSATLQNKWPEVLRDLEQQMTQKTFDAWLRSSRLVDIDPQADALVIAVGSDAARQWVENRLYQTIQRVVLSVTGYPWGLKFVVSAGPPSFPPEPEPPAIADPAHTDERKEPHSFPLPAAPSVLQDDMASKLAGLDYFNVFFKAGGLGYAMLSHYASYFWQPYLGQAFALWKRIDADERSSVKQIENRWSAPRRYRYRQLARAIGKDHPRVIKGGPVECWHTKNARNNGQQVDYCCGNADFQPVCIEHGGDTLPRCMHWHTGLLQTLADEGLAAIGEKEGEKWLNRLEVQVWRLFPVLTPWQVKQLNGQLQDEHERWLEGRSDRPTLGAALGVSLREWQQIEVKTLVPLMPGYDDYRLLFDTYAPDAEFLAQALVNNGGKHLCRTHHKIVGKKLENENLVACTPQDVDIINKKAA